MTHRSRKEGYRSQRRDMMEELGNYYLDPVGGPPRNAHGGDGRFEVDTSVTVSDEEAEASLRPPDAAEPSLGMKRVLNHNYRETPSTTTVRISTAQLIDRLLDIQDRGGEAGRCAAIAITKYEEAAMFAVKALTTEEKEI